MKFRYCRNIISQASKGVAAGVFTTGLLLVGFGLLIYLLPRLFATLAAVVFLVVGIGCITTAVKIFIAQKNLGKFNQDDSMTYRKNVRIHNGCDEFFDF